MSESKVAFVGSKKGEVVIAISPVEVMLGVDLSLPGIGPFTIKNTPGEHEEPVDVLFAGMLEGLLCLVRSYFEAQHLNPDLITQLNTAIEQAVDTLGTHDVQERDGESGILEQVRDIENETMFEAEFDVPEGFLEEAHRKVVTANATIIRRQPPKLLGPTKTGPQTRIVQRPAPSLKNIIQKFRGQQNKPLSGPLYVLVYDSCGRPVGVRSLKGPGWNGIGGGGKVAAVAGPHGGTRFVTAGVGSDIENLQPSTVLSLFHGCSPEDAYKFITEGIDASTPHGYRKYPHMDAGMPVLTGLFVAPDFQTAKEFGRIVIKFKTTAEHLHYMLPGQEAEADDMWRDKFPNSFRPSVSWTLVQSDGHYDPRKGGYAAGEHQALFLGEVSPRAIEKVYVYNPTTHQWSGGSAPQDYAEDYALKHNDTVRRGIEPQETFTTFDDFLQRFGEVNAYSLEELQATMKWMGPAIARSRNPEHEFGSDFNTVPRSVIKRVLPLLLQVYPTVTAEGARVSTGL